MPEPHRTRTAAPRSRPPRDALDLDAFRIDDEFDPVLDSQLAALRAALADFRSL